MLHKMYGVLNGEEQFSEDAQTNPLFKKVGVPYMHKIHRNIIIEMNAAYKRRPDLTKPR